MIPPNLLAYPESRTPERRALTYFRAQADIFATEATVAGLPTDVIITQTTYEYYTFDALMKERCHKETRTEEHRLWVLGYECTPPLNLQIDSDKSTSWFLAINPEGELTKLGVSSDGSRHYLPGTTADDNDTLHAIAHFGNSPETATDMFVLALQSAKDHYSTAKV